MKDSSQFSKGLKYNQLKQQTKIRKLVFKNYIQVISMLSLRVPLVLAFNVKRWVCVVENKSFVSNTLSPIKIFLPRNLISLIFLMELLIWWFMHFLLRLNKNSGPFYNYFWDLVLRL